MEQKIVECWDEYFLQSDGSKFTYFRDFDGREPTISCFIDILCLFDTLFCL